MKYSGSVKIVVMKKILLTACVMTLAAVSPGESQFRDFVRVQGDRLVEDGKPFRFISWNIPNLHLVEDYIPFEPPVSATGEPSRNWSGWRLPDRFEITDALATVKDMGGTVVRTYVLSVRRTQDSPDVPRHVLGPGQFNEEAFRTLDQVLQVANEQGVRLIIPFVCNWHWWGGRAQYAGFRGKSKDDFWTDPQLIADLKETIRFVVTRTNTLTGVRYADDKAILCWETGNELECPPSFTREIAAYIKSLDPNHPVMEGLHGSELREESLAMPEVDIVTTHHYPGMKKSFAQLIRENAARAKGRKPYIVGEFGFVTTQEMTEAIQATVDTQTAGALAWSLRFRSRDGGFYWHSEPSGGNKYKAFHWPGSPLADDYDEVPFMQLMRNQAFAIRGLTAPPLVVPAPPKLLPITDVSAISWQGSVGAQVYVVERAPQAERPLDSHRRCGGRELHPIPAAVQRRVRGAGRLVLPRICQKRRRRFRPVQCRGAGTGVVQHAGRRTGRFFASALTLRRTGHQIPRLPLGDGRRAPRRWPGGQ